MLQYSGIENIARRDRSIVYTVISMTKLLGKVMVRLIG